MHALILDAATVEVVTALRAERIEPLLLKGLANHVWLWPEQDSVLSGDVDLLIEPERFADAGRVLAGLGFEVELDDSDLVGQNPHGHHWLRRGVCIDLHRTIFAAERGGRACWSALWRDHETLRIAGVPIAVPAVPARALQVAVHAIQHPGSLDQHTRAALERAIAISDAETWTAAAAIAAEIGATAAFDAGLRMVPAGVVVADRLNLSYEPTAAVRRSRLGLPAGLHGVDQLIETRGARRRLALVAHKLLPSRRLIRAWSPLARRGTIGLILAYLWRPFWVLGKLPGAVLARRRGSR